METGRGRWKSFVPRSTLLAAVAGVVLVVGLLDLFDLLPASVSGWLCSPAGSFLSPGSLTAFMQSYGYVSLYLLMTAEGASAPIPSEVILPVAGFLVSDGALPSLPLALVVSTAGALTGSLIDYGLALFLGRPFVEALLRIFRLKEEDLDRAERWFQKSGQWTVFAARFVPLLRALISLPAGLFRMRVVTFVAITVVGCAIWNGILLYAGFAAGRYLSNACVGSSGGLVVQGVALVSVLSAVVYLAYYFLGGRREEVSDVTASQDSSGA